MEHFFSPNLVEDQKTKKGLHQKETFFPKFKWTPTLRCTPESNYWGVCRCTAYSNYWGDTVKLLGGMYPPSPRVSAPLAMRIVELLTITYHKVGTDILKILTHNFRKIVKKW